MFEITSHHDIKAPASTVWSVICNTADYPLWNPFVVGCQSSFEVGSPIIMKVRVFGKTPMRQQETILANRPGEFLEYGIRLPLGLLSSSRQHIVRASGADSAVYESVFRLEGLLSSLVGTLLGNNLRRGFAGMSAGIVARAEDLARS